MSKALIAVNAGSATLKFRAYTPDGRTLLARGMVDRFGMDDSTLELDAGSRRVRLQLSGNSRDEAIGAVLNLLADQSLQPLAVAHRVVHGGEHYHAPVVLTAEVLDDLAALIPLAPLHQPVSLAVMSAFARLDPQLTQIACFDTAFHAGQPAIATRFGIARHWHDAGIRRYGFHGLSYAAIARHLPELGLADARVVVLHLGSGASACALQAGQSVASSMGFSAVDGLMMGSRPAIWTRKWCCTGWNTKAWMWPRCARSCTRKAASWACLAACPPICAHYSPVGTKPHAKPWSCSATAPRARWPRWLPPCAGSTR